MISARWWRITWVAAALSAVVLVGCLAVSAKTAHAKSLGGVASKTLLGERSGISAITDKFDRGNNSPLAGSTDTNGDAWAVGPGTYRITNPGTDGYVKSTVTAAGEATVPGTVEAAVGIDLSLTTTSTGCGVVLNSAGASSYAATFLVYDRSAKRLTLERLSTTGTVTWSVGPVSKSTVNTYLFLTYTDGVYNAYQDGVLVLTKTLTTAQRTEAEGYSRIGFGSVSGTSCKFDNFQGYPR